MSSAGANGAADFYRRWSSRAAELALDETQPSIKRRCAHSAGIWAQIADAIDAGDRADVARLTANIAYMEIAPPVG